MREFFGLLYDPDTGELFNADGSKTGFSFVKASETQGFPVNPLQFASKETAEKIAARLAEFIEDVVKVQIIEVNLVSSPASNRPFPERIFNITTKTGKKTKHNAGLIASSIVRVGWKSAMKSLATEIANFAVDKD
jgi:hypothetical protein